MKILRMFTLILLLGALVVTANAQDAVSDLLGRINGLRGSLGLPGYTLNGALNAAALNQAQWMASTGQISHTQSDGSTPSSRAAAAGYGSSWVSENIYAGTNAGVGDAWVFWLNSPIHYRGMTNPNYQEIGIAAASGSWGRAYVLVFGNTGGTPYRPPSASSGRAGPSAPPSFVVGVDNFGNIMHEVQPEQTIGDILLTYGYTWDDLAEFLALNEKTNEDIRRLQIGEIVLVPPYEGTYTPTPYPEGWPTNTPEPTATPLPEEAMATAIAEAAQRATLDAQTQTAQPTATPTMTPTRENSPTPMTDEAGKIATSAGIPAFLASSTPAATADQPTATPSPPRTATVIASLMTASDAVAAPLREEIAVSPQGESPWLILALIVQSLIIIGAGVFIVRGMRRK